MGDNKQSIVAKIVGAGVALAAAWVAQKAITSAWKAATGHEPPAAEDETDARFAEIATAAALTGALVALARALAARGTARYLA